ncbi:MAG: cytochrome c oxidase subunit II [Thermoanaerobaculia bacterium]
MLEFLRNWLPIDVSAHGPQLDRWTAIIHWLMLVLFVGWGIYFVIVLFRFRASRHPRADYEGTKTHFSTYVEVGVALFEAFLLLGFAIPAWAKWVQAPDPAEHPIEVHVVGEQFAWNVHYPGPDGAFGRRDVQLVSTSNPLGIDPEDPASKDDVTTVNQLRLPVDRPVTVLLTSKDVIHSFGLPYFRVKQDAIPGMQVPVHFTPTMVTPEESRFPKCAAEKNCWEIACAQLCGLGHFRMRGYVQILAQDEYDQWLSAEVAKKMPAPEPEPAAEPAAEEGAPVSGDAAAETAAS